jgi:hydrogenase expression/formation protein HypE
MTRLDSVTDTNNRRAAHTGMPRGRVTLAHGGGGQLTDELLDGLILPRLSNELLDGLLDSAMLEATGTDRLAMTIDSYVVQPWRFPGGDIGRLAVCGTVNDLAVCGGKPVGIALSLILSEGFEMSDLAQVVDSIASAGEEAGVPVVTGDTKVVGRGQADGVYITTAGVARVPRGMTLRPQRVQPGDVLIVNGPVGEHGLAVMLAREMPQVQSVLRSDAAPLNGLIQALLKRVPGVLFMRDATRSGLAGVACDLARDSGWRVTLDEARIPVRPGAQHAADMLGLDPLEVANEGKVVAVVRPYEADAALSAMRSHRLGRGARIIGHVGSVADGLCELRTLIGGRRIVQKPYGEQLPRIC